MKYRNDYDTPRSIPDANAENVLPGAEFDSEVELHNPHLTPIDQGPVRFNDTTFRWERHEAEAGVGSSPDLHVVEDERE